MSGNICRCGAYSNIIDAIRDVARRCVHEALHLRARRVARGSGSRRGGHAGCQLHRRRNEPLDLMKLESRRPRT